MVHDSWIDPDSTLLGPGFPLPLDAPFTRRTAIDAGLNERRLASYLRSGRLRRILHGVYAAAQAPDSVLFRAQALGLVLADEAVVTGRTAAWLHGIPVLERGAHLVAPPVHVSDTRDTRTRRTGVRGDRRRLTRTDVTYVGGVRVTTVLRTACDLGRMLWRLDAMAALDGALALGVDRDRLIAHVERFKGFRGVRQLRELAPYAEDKVESPGESALRVRWLDAGLPPPRVQFPINDGAWSRYRLDMALELIRYGVEYDGRDHHTSPDDRDHDDERRAWIRDECRWTLDVFRFEDVYRPNTDIEDRLREGARRARVAYRRWSP